jgi:hypothetical protein
VDCRLLFFIEDRQVCFLLDQELRDIRGFLH